MSRLQEKFGPDQWDADHGWDRRSVILLVGLFLLAILAGLFVASTRSPHAASPVVAPALAASAVPVAASPATPVSTPGSASMSASPGPSSVADQIVVEVVGKVRNPGVFTLAPGARVHDVLLEAGGVKSGVDTSDTNLARILVDGEQIRIGLPVPGASGPLPQPTPSGDPATSGLVNINTADATTMQEIPGIGPVLAQRIVTYREQNGAFSTKEQLMEVSGIGETTLAEMLEFISL